MRLTHSTLSCFIYRPYPGRSALQHSQIIIEKLPQNMAKITGRDSPFLMTLSMSEVKISTSEERRELLRHLLMRGLPQNQEFETVTLAVLLYERFNEKRTRFVFADWILHAASSSSPPETIEIERGRNQNLINQIIVKSVREPYPLPALSVLFPSESRFKHPNSPPSTTADSFFLVPHLEPPLLSLYRSTSGSSAAGRSDGSPYIKRFLKSRHLERRDSGASDCGGDMMMTTSPPASDPSGDGEEEDEGHQTL